MAERHPWNARTVGTVAGLAGVVGLGIGYGIGEKAPRLLPATVDAAEVQTSEVSDAAIPDTKETAAVVASDDGRDRSRPRKRNHGGPVDLSSVPGEEWITRHDPERTWPGFNLVFYQRRLPMLIDMSGRIVHSWPNERAVGRARLTTQGHLLYIAADDSIREVDWDGNLVRSYKSEVEERFPHHDLKMTPDDRIAVIYRTRSEFTDDIVFVNPEGTESWTWASKGRLDADFPANPEDPKDLTHFNSVQVIPDNPHHRAGDRRFKAGNVLISARHLDHIYMVDPDTGEVVWKYGEGLDWQHEAVLLGDDSPSAGNILVFNNRFHSEERRSEVIELNPLTNEVVWRYSAEGFFSDTAGVAQKLPNGNVLITSSRGGRLFEVTPEGDLVWQWQPPYLPMRANRYAPDYCPQLAAMEPPGGPPVTSKETRPHIDSALYDFKMSQKVQKVLIGEKKRQVLTRGKVCHPIHLPGKPSVVLDMGFVVPTQGEVPPLDGSVKLTVTPAGGTPEILFDRTLSLATDGSWIRERVRLPQHLAYQAVEMCIDSTASDIRSERDVRPGLVVAAPKIMSGFRTRAKDLPSVRDKATASAERELQQRQLEALGYIE